MHAKAALTLEERNRRGRKLSTQRPSDGEAHDAPTYHSMIAFERRRATNNASREAHP
jgi:hypothetical protein